MGFRGGSRSGGRVAKAEVGTRGFGWFRERRDLRTYECVHNAFHRMLDDDDDET